MAITTEVTVPDIGDFQDVPIIEIAVAVGDLVSEEDPLVTLESDKATMDVPSPAGGRVAELRVALGDRVSEGSPILLLEPGEGASTEPSSLVDQQEPETEAAPEPVAAAQQPAAAAVAATTPAPEAAGPPVDIAEVHAGPSVRRLARELAVDITAVTGTGPKGRITKEDLLAAVRGPAGAPAAGAAAGAGIPEVPLPDFAQFGPIETQPLPRIKRISGPFLHRSWLNVPHVTHNDEADITDLDGYRKEVDTAAKEAGYRVTLLAFLLKAAVSALKEFPEFNSSLNAEKDGLILKRYYHLGVAVDTPDGLVVPVLRDVDRKGVTGLSKELAAISRAARDGKLAPAQMQGASFTVSSLGGIGGTSFIGDVVGQPMLAHKASHEGKVAAEVAAGRNSYFDARAIPSVAYTDPEAAEAGRSTPSRCCRLVGCYAAVAAGGHGVAGTTLTDRVGRCSGPVSGRCRPGLGRRRGV